MKFPKPWYRKNRGWYVTLRGKQIPLGAEKKAAFDEYQRILREPPRVESSVPDSDSLAVLIDQFLDWVQLHRAADTYEWYQYRLERFVQTYPDLTVAQLKSFHVQQWIDGYQISNGSKRNYCRAIQRCLRWCEEQGLIDRSPIAHFKKPRGGIREVVISPEEYQAILGATKRQAFRDLCIFAWETGARAAECLKIERRHLDLANHRIVLPRSSEKMQRAPRIIYLTESSELIVRRLALKAPVGKLFRNSDGNAWTTDAVNCAFVRIETKLKRKYGLTAFRHSFAHRKLTSGVDALTVAVLLGHSDPTMVAKVYGHLTQAPGYLLKALRA
ncbi:MAG: tyrosine-type recombinase/integrase [Pirellulales bacterium]|nr:tyrosine-type recombinase/integrase [Pirellulales bacterium]